MRASSREKRGVSFSLSLSTQAPSIPDPHPKKMSYRPGSRSAVIAIVAGFPQLSVVKCARSAGNYRVLLLR